MHEKNNKLPTIIYFGFNSFIKHKRGVENVIDFQSKAFQFQRIYYIHWDLATTVYKNNKIICISVKHCWYWPLILNLILIRLRNDTKFIIHSHNPLFSFISIFNTNIMTVHDALYYLNKSKKNKYAQIFKIIEILLYLRCSIVHFISAYAKDRSLFGSRKNYVIIHNTSHYENHASNIISRKKISKAKNILIVRSIEERARFDLLLNVADHMINKNFKFIIAGKGPLLSYYQCEIKKRNLKNIEMLGYVIDDDLLQLYSMCDAVLLIAEYGEGFGLPIIEGYLFNKPVIASNCCAIPEIIISDKYLFENEVENIISAIQKYSIPQKTNYREYYNKKYSNKIIMTQFSDLYRDNTP